MKAVILRGYGDVGCFEMAELPLPVVKKGEVLIRVMAVSFNPVDYRIRKGMNEARSLNSDILGRDLSGVIMEVGEQVVGFKPGDEVFSYVADIASSGTYTEYVAVPFQLVCKKPASLTHGEAAAITASMILEKTKPHPTASLFLAGGAGGVGSFVMLLAKMSGIETIVTTAGSTRSFYYLVQRMGLPPGRIMNYRDGNFMVNAVASVNGKFDVAIDLVGGDMLSACCHLLNINGHLASVTEAPERADFDVLSSKNASFHTIRANAFSLSPDPSSWLYYQNRLQQLAELFDKNIIAKPLITDVGTFSVSTIAKAHMLLEAGGVQGKLTMSFW
jgi:NADPH:quinone reductase